MRTMDKMHRTGIFRYLYFNYTITVAPTRYFSSSLLQFFIPKPERQIVRAEVLTDNEELNVLRKV